MTLSVAVRIRPLSADEESAGGAVAWEFSENSIQSISVSAAAALVTQFDGSPARRTASDAQYQFNYVCGPEESTSRLYKKFVRRSVSAFCGGQNACVLAFGETASGKTHSMLGDEGAPGIILLAVSDVFHHFRSNATREFRLRASYFEVLNEQVNCLLSGARDLQVVDDPANPLLSLISGSAVTVVGARDEFVNSPREFVELLLRGDRYRAVEPTELNRHSSRSHTILRLTLQSMPRASTATSSHVALPRAAAQTRQSSMSPSDSFGSASSAESATAASGGGDREACLFLVDLAGSESIAHLANEARRHECRFINKSLHCLERVIIKLAASDHHHIPYRDSNLTRVLQSSLGGGAHTAVLCNVCPTAAHRNETHKTLRFGSFARQVVHAPRAYPAGTDERALLLSYMRRVDELENRLKILGRSAQHGDTHADELMRLQRENRIMQIKLKESKRSQKFIEARYIDLQRAHIYGSMPHRSSASSTVSVSVDPSSSSQKLVSRVTAAHHAPPPPGASHRASRPAMSASSMLMAQVRARPLPPVLRANVHAAAPQSFARVSSTAAASAIHDVQVGDTGINNRSPSPDLPDSISASSLATSETPTAADGMHRPLDECCYRATDTRSPLDASSSPSALHHAMIEADCASDDYSANASAVVEDGSLNESAASTTYRSLSPASTSSSISASLSFTALGLSSSHDPSHFVTAADQPPPSRLAVEQRAASMPIIFSASLFSPTADAASTTPGQSPAGRHGFDFDMGDHPPFTSAARWVPDDAASSASSEPSPVQSPALPTFHRESPPPPSLQTGLQLNAEKEPISRTYASLPDRSDSITLPSADSPARDALPSSPQSSSAMDSDVGNSAEPLRSVSPSSVPSHAESHLEAVASSERSSPQPASSSDFAEIAAIAESETPGPILAVASESADSSSVSDVSAIMPLNLHSVMPPHVEIRPRDVEDAARGDLERERLARAHSVLQQRADDESKLARLALIQLLCAGVRVTKHNASSRGSRVVRLWFESATAGSSGASRATEARAAEKEGADADGWLCWDSASPWSRASRIPLRAIAALWTGRRAPAFVHGGVDDASPDAVAVSIRMRQVPAASARQSLDIHATDASTARLLLPALQALLPHVVVEM